jgi:hypothetical protein
MAITNEIFEHYRSQQRKVAKAKDLLKDEGYIVYLKPTKKKKQTDEPV